MWSTSHCQPSVCDQMPTDKELTTSSGSNKAPSKQFSSAVLFLSQTFSMKDAESRGLHSSTNFSAHDEPETVPKLATPGSPGLGAIKCCE